MATLSPDDSITAAIISNWLESRNLHDVASLLRSRIVSCLSAESDNLDSCFDSSTILRGIHAVLSKHLHTDSISVSRKARHTLHTDDVISGFLGFSNTESTLDLQKNLQEASFPVSESKKMKIQDCPPRKQSHHDVALETFPPVAAIKNKSIHLFEDTNQNLISPSTRRLAHSDSLLTFGTTALIVDNVLHDQNTVDLEQFLDDLHPNV